MRFAFRVKRQLVEQLLQSDQQAGSFLDKSRAAGSETSPPFRRVAGFDKLIPKSERPA